MTIFSTIKPWETETPGENLFLYLYELVAKDAKNTSLERSWFNFNQTLHEFHRLVTVIDLTHRCFDIGNFWLGSNPELNSEFIATKLVDGLEISRTNNNYLQLGELVRLACLATLNVSMSPGLTNTVHKENRKQCCWCGKTTSRAKGTPKNAVATVEHLWPKFLGGTSILGNLAIACNQCNGKRSHAISWAWFGVQSIYDKLDKNGSVSREIKLAVGLHRLIKVASGQSNISRNTMTLKEAAIRLQRIFPEMKLEPDRRYTFLDFLTNASE